MRHRSPTTDVVLAIAAAWAGVVVVQAGLASGHWLTVIGHTLALVLAAGLLGHLAAIVDNLVDDLRSGTGGRGRGSGRGGPRPVRARVSRPRSARGSGHPGPPGP